MAPQILFKGKTLIEIPKFNLVYSLPDLPDKKTIDWHFEDFGEGFHMASFSELIPLLYTYFNGQSYNESYLNNSIDVSGRDSNLRHILNDILQKSYITTATVTLSLGGVKYIKDHPEIKNSSYDMDPEELSNLIIRHENDVGFDKSGLLRSIEYNKTGPISFLALTGSLERADMLKQMANSSINSFREPYRFSKIDEPKILKMKLNDNKLDISHLPASLEGNYAGGVIAHNFRSPAYAIGVKEIKN